MLALTSIALVALTFLTFAFGVVEIALEHAVLRNFDQYAARTSTSWPEHHRKGPYRSLLLIPAHLTTGVTDAIIVSGAIARLCGFTSLLHAVTAARCNKQVKLCQGKFTVVNFITCVASTAATFAIAIYAFVKEYTSSEFRYTDFESSGSHFTRESWACQMEVQYRSKNFWGWTCSDAKVARWMLVSLLICLATLTTATYFTPGLRLSAAIELTAVSKGDDQEG